MTPKATNPPSVRTPDRKEKSFLVVNATIVKPPNRSNVRIPAVGITFGELIDAAT
jgi:hypothetical protein